MFATSDRLSEAFEEMKKKIEDEDEDETDVPDDLEGKVKPSWEESPISPGIARSVWSSIPTRRRTKTIRTTGGRRKETMTTT